MTDTTDLRQAVRDAIVTAPDMENLSSLADHIAGQLLGLGYPAKPEDTILVDAELDTDPETALDDALARWGRTAVSGSNLHAAVLATEFVDDSGRHAVVVYNPDPEFSPLHAIGILSSAVSAVRS